MKAQLIDQKDNDQERNLARSKEERSGWGSEEVGKGKIREGREKYRDRKGRGGKVANS